MDVQAAVDRREFDALVGRHVAERLVVVVRQVPGQAAGAGEHVRLVAVAEEHRPIAEIAAQAQVLLIGEDDLHGVDPDRLPQRTLRVPGGGGLGLGRGLGERGLSGLQVRSGAIDLGARDLGGGHDVLDRVEHVVPALGDGLPDGLPQLQPVPPVELVHPAGDGGEDRVAVEELGDGVQLAHLADRAGDGEGLVDLVDRGLRGVLAEEFEDADEVVAVLVRGAERQHVGGRELVPGRVVLQIVLRAAPDQGQEFGGRIERVEVLVEAEERLPVVVVLPPTGRPEGRDVSLRETELDRDYVLGHAGQHIHGPSAGATARRQGTG